MIMLLLFQARAPDLTCLEPVSSLSLNLSVPPTAVCQHAMTIARKLER